MDIPLTCMKTAQWIAHVGGRLHTNYTGCYLWRYPSLGPQEGYLFAKKKPFKKCSL